MGRYQPCKWLILTAIVLITLKTAIFETASLQHHLNAISSHTLSSSPPIVKEVYRDLISYDSSRNASSSEYLNTNASSLVNVEYGTGEFKHLKYVRAKDYIHRFNVNTPLKISNISSLDLAKKSAFQIRVVYFVNTKMNENFFQWMDYQFETLPAVNEIYIVADSHNCSSAHQLKKTVKDIKIKRSKEEMIQLECHDDGSETFEYHGIKKLWDLGQDYPGRNDIAIYFHSRGVTRAKTFQDYMNTSNAWRLMENVFKPMDQVIEAFALFPYVDEAGEECSNSFFVWFNFMYIRGSYLNKLEEPILTRRRHYYEDWDARWGLPAQSCQSNCTERDFLSYPVHYEHHQCYATRGSRVAFAPNVGYKMNPRVFVPSCQEEAYCGQL